jgi:hypothetical protein
MTLAGMIMAGVAGTSALAGGVVLALPARSEGGIYGKRIAGTMLGALALMLTLFAWGLERAAG